MKRKIKRRELSNDDKLLRLMKKRYNECTKKITDKEATAVTRQMLGFPPLKKKRKIKRRG